MTEPASSPHEPLFRYLYLVPRVLLGLFIVFQFVFMLSDNLVHMESDLTEQLQKAKKRDDWVWQLAQLSSRLRDWADPPPGSPTKSALTTCFEDTRKFTRWYGQAIGQEQSWSLFAPNVSEHSSFPAVQFRWDDPKKPQKEWLDDVSTLNPPGVRPPVTWLSENEPRDIHSYFRLGHFRLRRYEGNLDTALYRDGLTGQRLLDNWTERIRSRVREEGPCMHAFLRWKLREFQHQNPDVPPPTQVLLLVRTYTIPDPPGPRPWNWDYQGMRPLARWQPDHEPDSAHYGPVEMFLPSSGYYDKMER